ncbi:MAG: extracellular solute-binding protein [Candidatus Eisenbacteria bacterium]|nr:extracellular solute-binding protein [Candidatus Eisenbacteria bacterium]
MFRSHGPALAALCAALLTLSAGCAPARKGDGPIVVWCQMDPQERGRFERNVAAYQAVHPGSSFQVVPYDTENLRQQFQTAAAGGGGPQLIFGPSDQVGPLSLLELLLPLDETLPAGFFDRFVPMALDTLDGHIWQAPDQVGNHLMLVYNRKYVGTPPATHDEFLALAKQQTRDGRYGFVMETTEPYWLVPFLAGFGGWVMDARQQPTLDTPAMRRALAYLADLKNSEGIMPRESNYQNAHTLFQEGKAAMIVNGPWSWADYRKAGIDLGIAPLWTLPGGGRATPMIASKGFSINVNCPKSQLPAVIEFVTYCTSPEAELLAADTLGVLPSNKAAYDDPRIQSDPILQASRRGFELGRRMPVVPEMRVLWDVMRPGLQAVMNGSTSPAAAAKKMQADAVQQIAGMKK